MAYKPGSFSKNFAWHGAGLSKLHTVVRRGFSGHLNPVSRGAFRSACGIEDPNLQLIPINFFLFNNGPSKTSLLAVDELVFQAVEQPHSIVFDRLGLFALHLSQVGNQRSGGTPWAREFVVERLWARGFWRRAELDPAPLDTFLSTALDARNEVRIKCRTNYRHLFKLCGYLEWQGEEIDNRDAPWLSSAVLLAWDRGMLSGEIPENPTQEQLDDFVTARGVFKLLGVPEDFAKGLASRLAPPYIEAGAVGRFTQPADREVPAPPRAEKARSPARRTRALDLEALARNINVSEVARTRREVEQQLRNARLAAGLKQAYGSQCMFCESTIVVSISPEEFYAEAAHIRPLGRPHRGTDVPQNMLVLCPNCHVQFDAGTLQLSLQTPTEMQIMSRVRNHPLAGKVVRTRGAHTLEAQYVDWHRNYWRARGM